MSKDRIIQKYMTHLPILANDYDSINSLQTLMRSQGIRHIPVISGLDIAGIVSDRDIKFARAVWKEKADSLKAKDIMSEEVFEVHPLTPLVDVVTQMEAQKIGSAIIKDAGVIVGIFTTIDALRALKETLS